MTDDTIYSRRTFVKLGGVATLAALAGCSGSSATSKTTTASGGDEGDDDFAKESDVRTLPTKAVGQATVEMTMTSPTEPVFNPEVIWVTTGGTVTWKNVDEDPHTATSYSKDNGKVQRIPDGGTSFDSDVLQTGDTYSVTFDTPGVYDYYCTPHEGLGMLGSVIVGTPDVSGQPGLAAPQSSLPGKAPDVVTRLNAAVKKVLSQ